jgi:cytochrome c oxidase subunit II
MMKLAKLLVLLQIGFLSSGQMFAQETNKTLEVHARRYTFEPAQITVKKGEAVRLKLFSDDVPHSLLIKDLGVDQTITKTHPVEVTITPQQAGDFHGQCGRFCGSGHGRMLFTVHVTGN